MALLLTWKVWNFFLSGTKLVLQHVSQETFHLIQVRWQSTSPHNILPLNTTTRLTPVLVRKRINSVFLERLWLKLLNSMKYHKVQKEQDDYLRRHVCGNRYLWVYVMWSVEIDTYQKYDNIYFRKAYCNGISRYPGNTPGNYSWIMS